MVPSSAARDRRRHPAAEPEGDGWTCGVCTFRNHPGRPGCEMCSAEPPKETPTPAQLPRLQTARGTDVSLPRDRREDAFRCPNCGNVSSASAANCPTCGKPKAWICHVCTLENPMHSARCNACNVERLQSKRQESSAAESEPDGWTCGVCTFRNIPGRPGCEMCSAEPPKETPTPAQAPRQQTARGIDVPLPGDRREAVNNNGLRHSIGDASQSMKETGITHMIDSPARLKVKDQPHSGFHANMSRGPTIGGPKPVGLRAGRWELSSDDEKIQGFKNSTLVCQFKDNTEGKFIWNCEHCNRDNCFDRIAYYEQLKVLTGTCDSCQQTSQYRQFIMDFPTEAIGNESNSLETYNPNEVLRPPVEGAEGGQPATRFCLKCGNSITGKCKTCNERKTERDEACPRCSMKRQPQIDHPSSGQVVPCMFCDAVASINEEVKV